MCTKAYLKIFLSKVIEGPFQIQGAMKSRHSLKKGMQILHKSNTFLYVMRM